MALTTSSGIVGVAALVLPPSGPYQATAARILGLWAAYIHTVRPPRQNPVMPSLSTSPLPLAFANAAAASKSDIISVSVLLWMIGMISAKLVILVRSALRAYTSGVTAK